MTQSLSKYNFGCVYKITNLVNGKMCMGQRIDPVTSEEKICECAVDLKSDGFTYTSVYKVATKQSMRGAHRDYKWEFIPKGEDI
jgi:hypothetical protein